MEKSIEEYTAYDYVIQFKTAEERRAMANILTLAFSLFPPGSDERKLADDLTGADFLGYPGIENVGPKLNKDSLNQICSVYGEERDD